MREKGDFWKVYIIKIDFLLPPLLPLRQLLLLLLLLGVGIRCGIGDKKGSL